MLEGLLQRPGARSDGGGHACGGGTLTPHLRALYPEARFNALRLQRGRVGARARAETCDDCEYVSRDIYALTELRGRCLRSRLLLSDALVASTIPHGLCASSCPHREARRPRLSRARVSTCTRRRHLARSSTTTRGDGKRRPHLATTRSSERTVALARRRCERHALHGVCAGDRVRLRRSAASHVHRRERRRASPDLGGPPYPYGAGRSSRSISNAAVPLRRRRRIHEARRCRQPSSRCSRTRARSRRRSSALARR